MRPADAIRGSRSTLLQGAQVAIGVTGSVAAVEAVRIARELTRHGATVRGYMTAAAARLLGPDALAWATGQPVVTELTGEVEHLGPPAGRYDLVLVAPATANSLAKIAHGIADDPVTTLVQSHLGTAPVLVAPAMHETMHQNPALEEVLKKLETWGVLTIPPVRDEGEAKLATPETVAEHAIRAFGPRPYRDRRVLVINGSTIEALDSMRVITNRSTGRMGFAVAREAFRLGATVELWLGHHHGDAPAHIPTRRFVTVADLQQLAPEAAQHDYVFVPAAISDFGPARAAGKLPSETAHALALEPLPKLLPALRKACAGKLVAWKAEADITAPELLAQAESLVSRTGVDAVVANRLEEVTTADVRAAIIRPGSTEWSAGTKEEVARWLLLRLAP